MANDRITELQDLQRYVSQFKFTLIRYWSDDDSAEFAEAGAELDDSLIAFQTAIINEARRVKEIDNG